MIRRHICRNQIDFNLDSAIFSTWTKQILNVLEDLASEKIAIGEYKGESTEEEIVAEC